MRNETKCEIMKHARKEWNSKGMKGETKIEMMEKNQT
jgi:hypothetical protein